MSILDTIMQKVTGSGGDSAAEPAVIGHLTDLVNSPEVGGYEGLMQKFQSNGLGDVAKSLASGASQSVSADQITNIFGQDRVNALASKVGMDPDQLTGLVAQHLPTVMSRLSGSAPQA
jgi:uncharacterized protein YidB (DUF937 family)